MSADLSLASTTDAWLRSVPFSERLFNTLDPVLQEVGREAENGWEAALREEGAPI